MVIVRFDLLKEEMNCKNLCLDHEHKYDRNHQILADMLEDSEHTIKNLELQLNQKNDNNIFLKKNVTY